MDRPEFVYVTYISSTAEKVWNALVDPKTATKYWQHVNISDWKPGSKWEHRESNEHGRLRLVGKVLESLPPNRLVITWAEPDEATLEEKHSRVTFEIEKVGTVVRLTVTHDRLDHDQAMKESIANGWPKVLSSLKSLLERGEPLPKLW